MLSAENKRKNAFIVVLAMLLCAFRLCAQQHDATGIVLKVDREHDSLVVSCDAIADYMDAMEMSFKVRDPQSLDLIKPGVPIRFIIVESQHVLYAEKIERTLAANFEPEGMQAGEMTTLQHGLSPSSGTQIVTPGRHVPDFELTDQAGTQVRLSRLAGKVVLLTFGYSRCPNPEYCFRLSNNLAEVERRFSSRAPRDLVLLTIAIDPEHDRGATLTQYAAVWKADPAKWHFLTGPLPEVQQVAAMFGMNFWRREGLLTHSLHTVILDRSGDLAANLEGNEFTAQQLGDLVETVMNRPH